jgi:dipeptidyl aminopeptidase/acylaminoacyl peptidase
MKIILIAFLSLNVVFSFAQTGYQKPPQVLQDILLAPPTPSVSLNEDGSQMLLLERNSYPSVEELAMPEVKLAGLRISPNNFAPTRQTLVSKITLQNTKTGQVKTIIGLPNTLKALGFQWNNAGTKFLFAHLENDAVHLYHVDVLSGVAKKINAKPLNMIFGSAYEWLNNNDVIYTAIVKPANQKPAMPLMPKGPAIQESIGKAAPSVTYQDLLKTPYDEDLFEFLATCQLMKFSNGTSTPIGKPAMHAGMDVSPDENYILCTTIQKPFSYLVTVGDFPSQYDVYDKTGKFVKTVFKIPSGEGVPIGNDNTVNFPRNISWTNISGSTLQYVQALDGGIFKTEMDNHDEIYFWSAPFTTTPAAYIKTPKRFRSISFDNEKNAYIYDGDLAKKQSNLYKYDSKNLTTILTRSIDDGYNYLGNLITVNNKFNKSVVYTKNNGDQLLFSNNDGASPNGSFPFVSTYNISTKTKDKIWQCEDKSFEILVKMIDADKNIFITRKETITEPANFYWNENGTKKQLTNFTDPLPFLRKVKKEKIIYKRVDGIDLAATVYMPENFNAKKDAPLPVFMWAYPREFKNAADAAQVRGSKFMFTRIGWGSPIYWVTQGYCVMDETEFPIVGEGKKEPNDNFIQQLEWNAKAAINKIAEMGYGDSTKVAVGGHSYGSFMTANLLAHTNLFKAGIARSGAHNRTLTPFGFQNERRTYWEAPDIYYEMSPFSYANKIKTPLLLIHGEMDNNPGTFPIQSERLYNAVKGHGGTVRYVSLPYESHGYQAKENLLHMLWEMNDWLNKWVKK